jgi:hypothetical protein
MDKDFIFERIERIKRENFFSGLIIGIGFGIIICTIIDAFNF